MKHVAISYTEATFTFDDMLKFAGEAWGQLGIGAVRKWAVYNEQYFGGVLRPIPLMITQTQPFGKRIGLCSHGGGSRSISINVPRDHNFLVGDNATLLHEMVHQCLNERGENAKHACDGWRREIMRLHQAITGSEIWAGRSKTMRQNGKVVRLNEAHANGRVSLTQDEISRWPHSVAINLGPLGK
jgi:hypothetical protein